MLGKVQLSRHCLLSFWMPGIMHRAFHNRLRFRKRGWDGDHNRFRSKWRHVCKWILGKCELCCVRLSRHCLLSFWMPGD